MASILFLPRSALVRARASSRSWMLPYATLMLSGLGMTIGAAHALQYLPRSSYDDSLYATVASTLYVYYDALGAVVQLCAVAVAAAFAASMRGRASYRRAAAGALCLVASMALLFAVVQPVKREWLSASRDGPSVQASYAALRNRWEYGHLAAFAAWFAGTSLLTLAVVSDPLQGRRP